jgi:hypothetical protein
VRQTAEQAADAGVRKMEAAGHLAVAPGAEPSAVDVVRFLVGALDPA